MATALKEAPVQHVPVVEMARVDELREHPANPRRTFDQAALEELASSIRQDGIHNPLIVRPEPPADCVPRTFQILAGARRFRAAKLAGLASVPVIVRDLDDTSALAFMLIDNLQRADVHPMDEALGYDQLRARGYAVEQIADRVGRSLGYVYDRLGLLRLTSDLQEAFLAGEIQVGHAVLLARLSHADQERAAEARGGLWTHQALLWPPDVGTDEERARASRKAVSVRELGQWIDRNVRLAPEPDRMLFPETALRLEVARESDAKVVPITREHYVPPDAKDPAGTRTFGPQSWKRADGQDGSKTCDLAVLGIVVVGQGRGESFSVCVAKDKCRTHWGKEIRERQARAKAAAAGDTAAVARSDRKRDAEEERWQAQQRRREEARQRFVKARPEILRAVAEALKAAPIGGAPATVLMHAVTRGQEEIPTSVLRMVPRGKSAEELVRHVAWLDLYLELDNDWVGAENLEAIAPVLGLDAAQLLGRTEEAAAVAPAKAKRGRKA